MNLENRECLPLREKEIWLKGYGESGEVHIIVSIFKSTVFVQQYDTDPAVWEVFIQSFHSKEVVVGRAALERELGADDDGELITRIEELFPGPWSVDRLSYFCRERGLEHSTHECGRLCDDLVLKFEEG